MQETLRVIFWLQVRNPKLQRIFKFGVVGVVGLMIQTLIFEILGLRLGLMSPSVATVVGGEAAIISNFIWNNLWTFRDHLITGSKIIFKFVQFNATSLFSLGIQFAILKFAETIAKGNDWVLRGFYAAALVIVILFNYFIYNKFIWKTSTKMEPNQK